MEIKLHSRSIVFIVEGNQPSMFTEKFLIKNKIFPEELALKKKTSIPPLSQYEYEEGYIFQAIDNRVLINCIYQDQPKIDTISDLKTFDLLAKASQNTYNAIDFIKFIALGINFKFFIDQKNLNNLIPFANKITSEVTLLKVSQQKPDYLLNYNFQRFKENQYFLELNFHLDLLKTNPDLQEQLIIDTLKSDQAYFTEAIDYLKPILEE